jgi:3-oxoacyl-[acyl-carrier protein] reductase
MGGSRLGQTQEVDQMDKRLDGRVAIVTGASRGIGRATAQLYAEHGAAVLVVYREDETGADTTVDTIRSAGGEATALRCDVRRGADTRLMATTAVERYGQLDILCANAAIFPTASIEDLTEEAWDEIHAVNLRGTFLSVKACLPHMRSRRYGKIVLVSSTSGAETGIVNGSNYGATKAGQIGFMRCACREVAADNITINAIVTSEIPLGRLADARDIADGVLFLSTDESSYITGQTLVIDGGLVVPETPLRLHTR